MTHQWHRPFHKDNTIIRERYQILSFIGHGAFGETYKVKDTQFSGITRVLKLLQPNNIDPKYLQEYLQIAANYFEREANILRRIGRSHIGIPELYDYFQENQKFYLVQEYIEGSNLAGELKNNNFSEQQVIEVLYQVLNILKYLEDNNVIHRDIKPENLMRRSQDNKIFLIDFGAVRVVSYLLVDSPSTTVIGTPQYMPQEQQRGKPTFASDIHALGKTAYQLLTGRLPDIINDEISWNRINCNPHLQKILNKMVHSSVDKRYQRAVEVLVELEPLMILGTTVNNRYRIHDYLGGNKFGYTYQAEDLERPYQGFCIIKQIKNRTTQQPIIQQSRDIFSEAVKKIEIFNNSGIAKLLNHFLVGESFYLVYEGIQGQSLKTVINSSLLNESEAVNLLRQVLEALSIIHQENIIHGDIRPSNIIKRHQSNKYTLIDFHQFRQVGILVNDMQNSTLIPTGYMPPEQIANQGRANSDTYASDIYAFGLTAITALTGLEPQQLQRDSNGRIRLPNQVKVSGKLRNILDKMVRVDDRQRYQSVEQVLKDLNASPLGFINKKWLLIGGGIIGIIALILIFYPPDSDGQEQLQQIQTFIDTGNKELKSGRANEAIPHFDNAIKLVEKSNQLDEQNKKFFAVPYYLRGVAKSQLKIPNWKESANDCQRATEKDSSNLGSWLCLGNAKKAIDPKGNYNNIKDYFDKASKACNQSTDDQKYKETLKEICASALIGTSELFGINDARPEDKSTRDDIAREAIKHINNMAKPGEGFVKNKEKMESSLNQNKAPSLQENSPR
jgi:eukaryotic-like serine/threonine-protein kinase